MSKKYFWKWSFLHILFSLLMQSLWVLYCLKIVLSLSLNLSDLNFLKRVLFVLIDLRMPGVIQGFCRILFSFLLSSLNGYSLSNLLVNFSRYKSHAESEVFSFIKSKRSFPLSRSSAWNLSASKFFLSLFLMDCFLFSLGRWSSDHCRWLVG